MVFHPQKQGQLEVTAAKKKMSDIKKKCIKTKKQYMVAPVSGINSQPFTAGGGASIGLKGVIFPPPCRNTSGV